MDIGVIFSFILRLLGVIVTVAGAFGLLWKLVKNGKLRAWRIKRGVRRGIRKRAREALRKQGVLSASRGGNNAVAQAEKAALGVFKEVGKDSQALAQAWLNREAFTAHVNNHTGAERRAALVEGARSLFDELLDIVVDGLCRLAETATDAPGAVKAGDEANAGRHVETMKGIEGLEDSIKNTARRGMPIAGGRFGLALFRRRRPASLTGGSRPTSTRRWPGLNRRTQLGRGKRSNRPSTIRNPAARMPTTTRIIQRTAPVGVRRLTAMA